MLNKLVLNSKLKKTNIICNIQTYAFFSYFTIIPELEYV